MAYEVVMPYHLHMPSYFLETFTEYPYPIIGCGGRVHLPEPTVTTLKVIHKANIVFLGEQTSPLLIK